MVVKLAYEAYMKAQPDKFGDRSKTVGASEIGLCARQVAWKKQGIKGEDSSTWGARHRGDLIERHMFVPAMKHIYGDKLLYAGDEQRTLIDTPLSATPDGLVVEQKRDALKHLGIKDIESDCFAVETKSIDPRANIEEEKTIHRLQVQTQMGAFHRKTKHKPMYAVLAYTDASFLDTVNEFVIRYDDKLYESLKRRAASILDPKIKQKPEGYIGGGWQCRYCPYLEPCNIDRRTLPFAEQELDPQRRAEIIDRCREINTIRGRSEADETLLREKQDELKERLREFKVREIKDVLKWQSIKGRSSYDIEAMKKAKIKVDKFEIVGPVTDRLTVSKILPRQ